MCDHVIDIILCNLELKDLANVSDTSGRLRNMAASVFLRKHSHRLISLDAFYHLRGITKFGLALARARQNCNIHCRSKLGVRIRDANIWFKLLRNFGKFIKRISIQFEEWGSYEFHVKIPNAMKNLFEYVLEYCTDSLELLDLHYYPYFTLKKPLPNLREFNVFGHVEYGNFNSVWKHWDINDALELIPNIRSLTLSCVPRALQKPFPRLERVFLPINSYEDMHGFVSFLQFNPQIVDLKIKISTRERNNVIYSAIEEHLTQLKTFKIIYDDSTTNAMKTYRFRTVEKFLLPDDPFQAIMSSFKFDKLKKLTVFHEPNPICMNFILQHKKLKTFKAVKLSKVWLSSAFGAAAIKRLTELPELKLIIIGDVIMASCLILKTILGNEWKEIDMTANKYWYPSYKIKFRRIK